MTQFERDLMKHFDERLHKLCLDTLHTAEVGGLDERNGLAILASVLSQTLATVSVTCGLPIEDHVRGCISSYLRVAKHAEPDSQGAKTGD